jgi:hypothetical protein
MEDFNIKIVKAISVKQLKLSSAHKELLKVWKLFNQKTDKQ